MNEARPSPWLGQDQDGPTGGITGPDSSRRRRLTLHWGIVAAWAAAIFFVSSLSSPPGAGGWRSDLAHPSEYAVLAVLVAVALAASWRMGSARAVLIAWALAVAYAVSDEFHQWFVPGRQSDPVDVMLDATGAALGLAAWWLSRRHRPS